MAIRLSLRRLSRGLRLLSKCAPLAEIAPGSPASPIGLLTGTASPRHRPAQAALRFSLGPGQLSSSAGPFLPRATRQRPGKRKRARLYGEVLYENRCPAHGARLLPLISKQEAGSLSFIMEGYHMLLPGPWINRTERRQRPRA
jgi:hypothetical protein